MTTIQPDQREFPHRLNEDGSYDSICPCCFITISRQRQESDLERFERGHVCDPDRLEHFDMGQKSARRLENGASKFNWNAA